MKYLFGYIFFSLILILSCTDLKTIVSPENPSIAFQTIVRNVDYRSTTISCTEKITNNITIKERGLIFSDLNSNPDLYNQLVKFQENTSSYIISIENLNPGTKYYYRPYIKSSNGFFLGNVKEFITKSITTPLINSSAINYSNGNTVIISGDIIDFGGGEVKEKGVVFSKQINPTISDNKIISNEESFYFELEINNLEFNQNYYFKAYAINEAGIGYSNEVSIKVSTFNTNLEGLYNLKGFHTRIPYNYSYDTEMELRKYNSLNNHYIFYWPIQESEGHPIGVGPNNELSWYGAAVSPVFEIDLSNNKIVKVFNKSDAVPINKFDKEGITNGNFLDQKNKIIYISFNYLEREDRAFIDTLTFIKPLQ